MKGKKTILTDEQREWLVANFADTTNTKCGKMLGVNWRTICRFAKELGLKKSKEFMKQAQLNAAERARIVNSARGGNRGTINLMIYGKPHRFKKGETTADRIGEERWREACRKGGETLKKLYESERRRVLLFGLEPKTKLRLVKVSQRKRSFRSNLRRKGYIIERASNDAYITEDTRRSALMERRAEAMGIHFYEYE